MPLVRLKPSIPVTIEQVTPGLWRVSLIYDGGRNELVLECDAESIDFIRNLSSRGVEGADARLSPFYERTMLIDVECVASLAADTLTQRQELLLCDVAKDGASLTMALERIKTAKIAVVGLGGIGSNVFDGMLRMGFEDIAILDTDVVRISNLNRQRIFSQEDLERPKTDAAIEYARQVNPEARICAHNCDVREIPEGVFNGRVIINCADQPDIRVTSSLLMERNQDLVALAVGGGYFCETSFSGPILLPDEKRLLEQIGGARTDAAAHMTAIGGNVFSSAVLPASICSFEVLRLVTGIGTVSLRRATYVFDWRNLTGQLIALAGW
jgi:hypothetical protein